MNHFNFQFQKRYVGLWNLPDNADCKFSGTLFIESETIFIDLFFQNSSAILPEYLESLHGSTFSVNEGSKEEYLEHIILKGLTFLYIKNFGNGLKHLKYEVKELIIHDNISDFDNIRQASLRLPILDKWTNSILCDAYKDLKNDKIPDHIEFICFEAPCPYILYSSEDVTVSIYFSYSCSYGNKDKHIIQKTFLNFNFKKRQSFYNAQNIITEYMYLLFLLINREFTPQHIRFFTNDGSYVYMINKKESFKFINEYPDLCSYTELKDFTQSDIHSIFDKWTSFYKAQSDAINTYYETLSNQYLPPSSQIRNYISFIDSVTKSMKGKNAIIHKESRRYKWAQMILEKTVSCLSKSEQKQLEQALLYSKGAQLKPRFEKLIEEVKDLLPNSVNSDFIEKIINTRNVITHPNTNEDYILNNNEYEDAIYKLTQIIRSFLLRRIGVNDSEIKKIIAF